MMIDFNCLNTAEIRDPQQSTQRKRKPKTINGIDCQSFSKLGNVLELLPVLESQSWRKLRSYSPIFIDTCGKMHWGLSFLCSIGNRRLVIKCSTAQRMKTFVSSTSLSNGKTSIPVIATSLQPPSTKDVYMGPGRGLGLDFELWYFYINFLVEKRLSVGFKLVKWNSTTVTPLEKCLSSASGNIHYCSPPLKKSFRRPRV